jgi:hypothetical protein
MSHANLSRRAILAGASSALPIAVCGSSALMAGPTAAAAIGATQPSEDANLIALGEQIDPLLAAYRKALAHHTEARALAEANCPQVPEELVVKGASMGWLHTEREQDVEGKDVWPLGVDGKACPPRKVLSSAAMKAAIERGYCDGRTKSGKRLRTLIRTAERYEAEREAAIEHSGVRAAADELRWAATDIDVLAWKIRDFAPVTVAGVQIQARALVANAESELHGSGFAGSAGLTLGRQLADAVLRVGEMRGAES